MEGWIEAGNVVQELLLGGQVNQQILMNGTEDEQALALSLIANGKLQTRLGGA